MEDDLEASAGDQARGLYCSFCEKAGGTFVSNYEGTCHICPDCTVKACELLGLNLRLSPTGRALHEAKQLPSVAQAWENYRLTLKLSSVNNIPWDWNIKDRNGNS